ncbi:hypothetical protein BsWGS_12443 [Bradybaena similaris]
MSKPYCGIARAMNKPGILQRYICYKNTSAVHLTSMGMKQSHKGNSFCLFVPEGSRWCDLSLSVFILNMAANKHRKRLDSSASGEGRTFRLKSLSTDKRRKTEGEVK